MHHLLVGNTWGPRFNRDLRAVVQENRTAIRQNSEILDNIRYVFAKFKKTKPAEPFFGVPLQFKTRFYGRFHFFCWALV